ncbi:MAG: efflux RND transporter permease subunit, partial [Burkholderiaceae bacterium]
MFLSNFSVRRPVATVVIIFGLMAMGLMALTQLKVNERPDVALPLLVVNIPYPGASPETVERELLNRVEKSLQSVNAVREVRSSANEGSASIQMFFEFGKNLVEGADEVRNALGAVRYKLPTEIREPVILRIDPSAQPIMQVALSSSTQTHAEISRLAEDQIADRFRAISGIAQVNVYGALRRELSVLLQAQKMRELNVTVTEVLQALRTQNTAAPVGKVRGLLEDQSIRLMGRLEKPEEFAQIVVRRSGSELVRLGQVAVIQDGFAEVTSLSQRNGKPNVGLSIVRSREASTVSVAADVRALVKTIEAELPQGTSIAITEDGGKNAQRSLNNVIEALVLGAVLTVLVVYVFLNSWRSTLITALSLPTSVLTSFIAVWLCGFTLNFMTLLGLSLAIGVLPDAAIVVRENIVRPMERGAGRVTAALQG